MSALTWALSLLCLAGALALIAGLVLRRAHERDLARLNGLLDSKASSPGDDDGDEAMLPAFLMRCCLRAGWEPRRKHVVIALAGWMIAAAVTASLGGVAAAALAALALPLLAWLALEARAAANMARLSVSMLGLLERIRQLLSVGHSLQTALARAVENAPPVMARALAPTLRRIINGAGVADSVERAASELDLYELHLLGTAARTNLRFGGSMGAILKDMIETIRRRAMVERELRANTTQIRASAWVLALLPLLVAGVVMTTNHGYARWFLVTPAGHRMIVYALVSQGLGILAMRAITKARY
jgi:tight adherence protein B